MNQNGIVAVIALILLVYFAGFIYNHKLHRRFLNRIQAFIAKMRKTKAAELSLWIRLRLVSWMVLGLLALAALTVSPFHSSTGLWLILNLVFGWVWAVAVLFFAMTIVLAYISKKMFFLVTEGTVPVVVFILVILGGVGAAAHQWEVFLMLAFVVSPLILSTVDYNELDGKTATPDTVA